MQDVSARRPSSAAYKTDAKTSCIQLLNNLLCIAHKLRIRLQLHSSFEKKNRQTLKILARQGQIQWLSITELIDMKDVQHI